MSTDGAGWESTRTYRVVLSDDTLWCESSIKREVLDALCKIRTQAVTVHYPSGDKTFGPDRDARFEHLWERHQSEWRACGVHDNCPWIDSSFT